MSNRVTNSLILGVALAVFLVADASTASHSVPGWGASRLSAQESTEHSAADEEQMFLEARRALNRDEFDRASDLFGALRTKYPNGRFMADSYYWEAFGRYREGDMPEALALLDLASVQDEATRYVVEQGRTRRGRLHDDVRALRQRIQRRLAEQGNAQVAEEVLRQSEAILAADTVGVVLAPTFSVETVEPPPPDASRTIHTVVHNPTGDLTVFSVDSARFHSVESAADFEVSYHNLTGLRRVNLPRFHLASPGVHVPSEGCEDALVKLEAFTSLLRLETDRMPTVRNIIEDDDACSPHLRHQAVTWLVSENTEEALKLLIEVAKSHPDLNTRSWAISGLADFESPAVVQVFMDALYTSDDLNVQRAAISGLDRHSSEAVTEVLIDLATDDSWPPEISLTAATMLGERLESSASFEEVFWKLDSDAVRIGLLHPVSRRAEEEGSGVTGWLMPVVTDKAQSDEVRATALRAWSRQASLDLKRVGEIYGMMENADLRDQLLYALYQKAESDDENADALIDQMIDLARAETDLDVRKRAIYWLGRTGSVRAATFLMEILREGNL